MDKKWYHKSMIDWWMSRLPYNKEDEQFGMVCTSAGSIEIPPNTAYSRRTGGEVSGEYQLLYISRGEGLISTPGNDRAIGPGTMLLLPPGLKYRYRPVFETGWYENRIGFKGSYFDGLVKKGFFPVDRIFFTASLSAFALFLVDRILDEVKNQKPLYQMRACSTVLTLISELFSRLRRQDTNPLEQIVEKSKLLMVSNMYGELNLSLIAGELGISVSRFNEIFKKHTNTTPYQYYINIKIGKARELLAAGDISVKETAWRMGFNDQYYFSRLFKNKTGMAPSELKKYGSRFYPYEASVIV